MDSVNSGLRVFEIPETLDWRSLLRPPGPDYVNFLDASLSDDPETWTESDVFNALEVLKQTNFKNVGDCLNVLTPDLFNTVFSLNRCYTNLEKQNQILLCQFLSTLCSKVHFVLESIPPKPYTSDKDSSENHIYKEFVSKIACFTSNSSEEDVLYPGLDDSPGYKMDVLSVGPKTLGIVLRSLVNVSVFLICMCYRFVSSLQKNEETSTFELIRDKNKRGRKGKKDENQTKANTMAIETIVEGLLSCCKYNYKYPYSSDYGGSNRPSVSTLRMLFQTLLHTLSLDEKVHQVSNNMIQSIAKIIKINFSTMQSNKINHYSFNSNLNIKSENSEQPSPETYGLSSSVDKVNTQSQDSPNEINTNVEDLGVDNIISNEYDDEWLYMLLDEIKKPQCVVIVDVLELIKDSNIPNIIVNELFFNIKENYSSQISNSNQLISSLVQNEFTNIGMFFEKMAKKVPCVVLSNINQLKQLFDVPCYPLRKSIMEAIKLLIILSKYYDTTMGSTDSTNLDGDMENLVDLENLDDKWMKNKKDDDKYKLKTSKLCCRNREMLLDIIISRQFDVYMYARACVLKVLYDLVESDALPVRKYNLVVSFAAARLMDKGSQVRQKALALVSLIVDVVTNTKFLLALDTDKLNYELGIVESNIKKVNFLLSEHSMRKYNINTSSIRTSRSRDKDSPRGSSRSRSRRDSLDFVDVHEYDYDLVLMELKCDFGKNVLNKLDELHNKLQLAKELYNDALEISERVDACLNLSLKLLRSPTETDQKATIKFISSCHLLGLEKATKMLPQVWALSWSNSQSVVESVLLEFKNVYFQKVSNPNELHECCNLLINLINTGDLTCLSSVEKMFQINQNKQQLLNINLKQLIKPLIKIATTTSLDSGKKVGNKDNNDENNSEYNNNQNKDLLRCKTTLNLIKIILSSSQNHHGSHDHNTNVQSLNNTNSNNDNTNTCNTNGNETNKTLSNDHQNNLGGDNIQKDYEEYKWDMSIFTNILMRYNEDILLEVCQILIYVKKDEKVQDFVQQILKIFLNYFGTTNFNWFQIAQIVIDLSFTHLYNPLLLWSNIIKELLSQLISDPDPLELTDLTQRSQMSYSSQVLNSSQLSVVENGDQDFDDKNNTNYTNNSNNIKCNNNNQNDDSTDLAKTSEARKLSHLIFITGHVSIRSIIYIEKVQNDLKVARSNMNEVQVENNMGLATKDEMEREFFDNIIENKLVNDNLLGGPMFNIIIEALVNPQQFIHPEGNVHSHNFFDNINFDMLKSNGYMKNNRNNRKDKHNVYEMNGNNNHNRKIDDNDNNNNTQKNEDNKYTICVVHDDEYELETCLECNILFICSVISLCKFSTVSKNFCNIKLMNNMTIIQIIISLLLYSNYDSNNNVQTLNNTNSNNDNTNTANTNDGDNTNNDNNNNTQENEDNILNSLKCNLLICYGDLLVRHPNIMEPMNDFVFTLLSYPVVKVRETAILVFSHLVMNDMIKPKGKLLDNIMFLTQDNNEKISNYAKVFLNEIHRKNPNTIYNCFPEMLSTLSQPSTAYVNIISQPDFVFSETTLQENYELQGIKTNLKILNEIFNFVKNDKQEHLVEKICIRLNKAKTIFATTVYINALLLINYDEKNIIKLSKSLNLLRQLLSESQPLLAALCIIHKRIKSTKGPKVQGQVDIKEVADEMMNKVKNILGQGKATMLIRASQFSEQIIELLNSGNYTSTNLRSLFDRENERKVNMVRVKKEDESSESGNSGDYLSSSEELVDDEEEDDNTNKKKTQRNKDEEVEEMDEDEYSSQSELKQMKKDKNNNTQENEDNILGDDEDVDNKNDINTENNYLDRKSRKKKNVNKGRKNNNKGGRKRKNIVYEESEDEEDYLEDEDIDSDMQNQMEEDVELVKETRGTRKMPERTKKNKFNVLESYMYNNFDGSEEFQEESDEDDYKNNTRARTNRGRPKRGKR